MQWSAYLRKFQFLLEVQGEDGLHAIVGEPLAELVPHDEEHAVGVPQLLKHQSLSINISTQGCWISII